MSSKNTALPFNNQKISIFSKHLHWLNWELMAETALKLGFDGIDLTVRPNGHVLPERVEEDLPNVFEICKNVGLEIIMICTNIKDVSDPVTEKIIKTASRLGIKFYRLSWYEYDKNLDLNKNLENIKSKLTDIAAMNEHYKIKGSYQNHDGVWFGAPVWDLGKILREINSKWLGCQFDILNAVIEASNSWQLGLEFIVPFIHNIDIKDAFLNFQSGKMELQYVPLGNGMVDFTQFIRLIKKFGISVPYSMHFEYDLGGADTGLPKISVPEKVIFDAIKRDLAAFKKMLSKNIYTD